MPKAATPPEPRSIDRSFLNAEPKGDTQTPVTQTRVEVFATACHYVADTLSPATHDLGHPAEKKNKTKTKNNDSRFASYDLLRKIQTTVH